ncbi:MAG: SPOR domain-containing protein [Tannerella sp.]|jgi:hypothetical protein|nr:SPOR domain-containing protein [Tannerella sp.]
MKRFSFHKLLLIILTGLYGYGTSYAQQSPYFSIFDLFEKTPEKGEGAVIIHQSESIKMLVGTRIDSDNVDVVNGKTYLKTIGYRVQIYSGNEQRKSKEHAEKLQDQLRKMYPDIQTYVTYYAPFWKLHAGNYRSFEEASQMLRILRQDFPQIKNEIYIVEDEIRLQLD